MSSFKVNAISHKDPDLQTGLDFEMLEKCAQHTNYVEFYQKLISSSNAKQEEI